MSLLWIVLILLALILIFGWNAVSKGIAGLTAGFVTFAGILLLLAIFLILFVLFKLAALVLIPIAIFWWWRRGRQKVTVMRNRWPK